MSYIKLSDSSYPHTERSIRSENQQTSYPAAFKADGYEWVFPTPQPVHDPLTQSVREIAPALSALNKYEQRWEIVALDAETIAVNQLQEAAKLTQLEDNRILTLWQAAHDYEYSVISGSAIGLLVLGVLQNKPKCVAVQNWIKSIWTEYYSRKVNMSCVDYNFSSVGTCPHNIPELMEEMSN